MQTRVFVPKILSCHVSTGNFISRVSRGTAFFNAAVAAAAASPPRAPKGERPQPRFRTAPCALACSVGRLRWARGLGGASGRSGAADRGCNAGTCTRCVSSFEARRVGRDGGAALGARRGLRLGVPGHDVQQLALLAMAAKGGHMKILQWLRTQGCAWDTSTCSVT